MHFVLPIPAEAPIGLIAPRVIVAGYAAHTQSGQIRGDLFLRPLRMVGHSNAEAQGHGGELAVRVVQAAVRADEPVLDLRLGWWTARPLSHNFSVSLRLLDAQGRWLRQLDTQPGYGFLPSSGWPVEQWVDDWLALALPDVDPAAGPYPLVVQLYDVSAPETAVLTNRLGALTYAQTGWEFAPVAPAFALPDGVKGKVAVFGDDIALVGYQASQQDGVLTLTLYWQALRDGQTDYTRFVHFVDLATNQPPLAQSDSFPVYNSYPTGQWQAGEVVTDVVALDVGQAPPGEYGLLVGFYVKGEDGVVRRVTAVDENGAPLPNDAVVLPEAISR
jgi:hypothetical protein